MTGVVAPEDELDSERGYALRRGTRLGRYELLLPIAKGGMARVWAARQHGQRGFTKLVAIKTILPHLAREPEFERMFLDEARIASLVHHPNVCEIYELGEEGRVLYLAMEWVHGDSLVHMLRTTETTTQPIPLRIAARIVADACAGLHAAHELVEEDGRPMNVVHRDVSPHNILVSSDGHVKVADFGVAKALGQLHQATVAGQIKGKLSYMAPEQITGAATDRRADIFSLGCVLYEATTGVLPFLGEQDHQVMHALIRGEYTMPTKLVRGYPPELEAIVARALAPDPSKRFATADNMRAALEEWLLSTGAVVTAAHVAPVARERVGTVIDKRKEKIREAIHVGGAHQTLPPASSSASSGVQMLGHTPPPGSSPSGSENYASYPGASYPMNTGSSKIGGPSPVSYLAAAGVGVFIALLVGAGGIFALRAFSKPGATVVVASQPGAPVPQGAATDPGSPQPQTPVPAATPVAAAEPAGVAQPMSVIKLTTSPDSALIIVNNAALPPGVRQIGRPPRGQSMTLRITAPGFVEATKTIDDSTPESLSIALAKVAVAQTPAAVTPTPKPRETSKPSAPSTPAAGTKPAGKGGPSLPDSPY